MNFLKVVAAGQSPRITNPNELENAVVAGQGELFHVVNPDSSAMTAIDQTQQEVGKVEGELAHVVFTQVPETIEVPRQSWTQVKFNTVPLDHIPIPWLEDKVIR